MPRTDNLLDRLPAGLRGAAPAEPMPSTVTPMLATLTDERFSDPAWLFERKWDGIRTLAFRSADGRVRLRTRNDQVLDGTYPEIAEALARQTDHELLLDGEVVAFDGRRTSFARLQGRSGITDPQAARGSGIAVVYYLFDVLHVDGRDVRQLPLRTRKRLLRDAVQFGDPLRFTAHRNATGEDEFRKACARGDEGVVAKRADAPYASGRSRDWLKFKCQRDQEFVIGGFTAPKGSRVGFGALLLGYYDQGRLVYAGKVGTGFDTALLTRLHTRLEELGCPASPFDRGRVREADVRWVRPELVAQIAFTEWTRDGLLRHPRFLGLRADKAAAEVNRET